MHRLAALLSLAALLLPTAPASPPPSSWVAVGHGQVIYLNWTDRGGHLSGTAQVSSTSGEAPEAVVSSTQVQLSGTEANGKVTLRFGGLLVRTTAAGSVSTKRLTVEWSPADGVRTDRFSTGGGKDYNRAVSRLKTRVAGANARALARQDAATVTRIFRALPAAIRAVQDDQTATQTSVAALTLVWDAQREASPVGTASCFTADGYAAASAAYDATSAPLQSAETAIATLKTDVAVLGMTPAGLNGHKRSSFTPSRRALLQRAGVLDTSATKVAESADTTTTEIKKESRALVDSVAAIPAC